MGITGLLQILKPVLKKKKISSFKGMKIGIDGHSWLHQCAPYIGTDMYYKKNTNKHLNIINKKLEILLTNKIIPVLVFDGDKLPSKSHTDELRKNKKQKIKEEIEVLIKKGQMRMAHELMKRCVSITKDLLDSTIEFLKNNGVEYIISAYESDAQLTYLQRIGYIDAIMAEDSDLIVYGCTNLCYKFDGQFCDFYERGMLTECWDSFFEKNILDISILSGCDYLPSIPGIGIKTAYKYLKEYGSVENIVNFLSLKKNIDSKYLSEFNRAKVTFLNQVVIDPFTKKRLHLSLALNSSSESYSQNLEEMEYLGSLENKSKLSLENKSESIPDNELIESFSFKKMKILSEIEIKKLIGDKEFEKHKISSEIENFIFHEEEECSLYLKLKK